MKKSYAKIFDVFSYVILTLLVVVLIFFILFHAQWLLGDQAQFIGTTAIHKVLPLQRYIIPSLGRFFPLGLMDYNALLLLPNGSSALAHYTLNAIGFLIFALATVVFYAKILNELSKKNFNSLIVLLIFVFLSQRVYSVYLDLIFPERIVSMLLAVFILFSYLFYKTEKWLYGFISLLSAFYLVYCKEPLFGALFIFAAMMLLFRWSKLSLKAKWFYIILVLNSIIFIVLYYFLVYRGIQEVYDGSHGENNLIGNTLRMVNSNKLVIVALLLALYRVFMIFIRKEKSYLFYDALLFAGIGYFMACLVLKLNFTYYYIPATILMMPAIIYFITLKFPAWVILSFTLLLAVYYGAKYPKMINNNQKDRVESYINSKKVADYIQKGYIARWYKSDDKKNWDNTLLLWEQNSLETYVGYLIKDENYKFKVTDSINSNEKETIYLYSNINEKIDSSRSVQFIDRLKHMNAVKGYEFSDISVYVKN